MGRRGRKVEIRPPEDFDKVYLPDERFTKIVEALVDLGFKVDAYMNVDFDGADRKILDTCLLAERDFDLGDVEATIVVHTCISDKVYSIDVDYEAKNLNLAGSIAVEAEENPNPDRFISKLKRTIENLHDIVEEDIRKNRKEILERRECMNRFERLMKELGFESDAYGWYIKNVNGYDICVIYVPSRGNCSLTVTPVEVDSLADVIRGIEGVLARLPKPSEPKEVAGHETGN